jgi:hypothetical protein
VGTTSSCLCARPKRLAADLVSTTNGTYRRATVQRRMLAEAAR